MRQQREKARLVLEDGTVWGGVAFGARGTRVGEVVFNTSLTGYQEILTDPSYAGQMVLMTASQIGNVGINPEDHESSRAWMEGFVVREVSERVSSWRATASLEAWLQEQGVVGIAEVDTRAIVRRLRDTGSLRGVLTTEPQATSEELVALARSWVGVEGQDLTGRVTCPAPYAWSEATPSAWECRRWSSSGGSLGGSRPPHPPDPISKPLQAGAWDRPPSLQKTPVHDVGKPKEGGVPKIGEGLHLVVVDLGVKRGILRRFASLGCKITVVPATTKASQILDLQPHGLLLSNGPGDPAAVTYLLPEIRALFGRLPIFGICLGHQILGLALGGKTFKLKFGHHGGNQPIRSAFSGKVEISSQNHNYAVDLPSLPEGIEITYTNLNDQTCEGFRHKEMLILGLQHHPEAGPGPHDSDPIFAEFLGWMKAAKKG